MAWFLSLLVLFFFFSPSVFLLPFLPFSFVALLSFSFSFLLSGALFPPPPPAASSFPLSLSLSCLLSVLPSLCPFSSLPSPFSSPSLVSFPLRCPFFLAEEGRDQGEGDEGAFVPGFLFLMPRFFYRCLGDFLVTIVCGEFIAAF